MRVFQVLNDNVLIINEKKTYNDLISNFLADGGTKPENMVIYDSQQKTTVVNGKFKDFPSMFRSTRSMLLVSYITPR